MSSTLKKIRLVTMVNAIVLLQLGRLVMAAPNFPLELLTSLKNCGQGNNCSQAEFCQEDLGFSYCVPCVDCSLFNREAGVGCTKLKEDCGECLPYYNEIDSHCTHGGNAPKWSSQKTVGNMCLEHYSPSSNDINLFLVSGAISIASILLVMLITSKLNSSNATALQLEQEILAFANRQRQLEAVRDRLITQADGSFRPPFTGIQPSVYNTISTIQNLAHREQLLAAALDYEIRQEHQRRDILAQNDETPRHLDDLNEASVLLEQSDEHRPTNKEPEQVVPRTENQNSISPRRLQLDTDSQVEMENDVDDDEFYYSNSQEQERRLLE